MVLPFLAALPSIASVASTVGKVASVAQGVGGILDALRGNRAYDDVYNQAGQLSPAEAEAISYYKALAQPNNSYVKSMTDSEMKANTEAFLSQLRGMELSNRRAAARGRRSTFFNPERADETIDFLATRGLPELRRQSEATARDRIQTAAAGLMGQAPYAAARNQNQMNLRLSREANRSLGGGYAGQIGNLSGGIQDLLKAIAGGEANRPSSNFVGPMPYREGFF